MQESTESRLLQSRFTWHGGMENKKAFQYDAYHPLANRTCLGHQMSVPVGLGSSMRSKALSALVTRGTPCGQTDTHEWKHYRPPTSLAGSNNSLSVAWNSMVVLLMEKVGVGVQWVFGEKGVGHGWLVSSKTQHGGGHILYDVIVKWIPLKVQGVWIEWGRSGKIWVGGSFQTGT